MSRPCRTVWQWFSIPALCLFVIVRTLLADSPLQVKVALLVGVNKYDKRGLADEPLQFAERDVQALERQLTAAGFRVRLLTGSADGQNRATLSNIQAALDETLRGRNADDIVLIALAGHGNQKPMRVNGVEKEEAYFCPVDGDKDDPATLFGLGDLIEKLDRKGGINLVLVDACRNDDTPGRGRGISGDKVTQLPARTAVLFSCSARQKAYETEKAGGGHGVFFHAVLEALQGEAGTNDRGEITWGRVAEYVQDRVPRYALNWIEEAKLRNQTPHEVKNLNLSRPPVLVKRTAIVREVLRRKRFIGTSAKLDHECYLRGMQFTRDDELILGLDRGDGDAETTTADNNRTRRPSIIVWDGASGELLRRYIIRVGVT